MLCPNCNSLNPDDAQWCSLCLTKFDNDEPEQGTTGAMSELHIEEGLDLSGVPKLLPPDPPQTEAVWQSLSGSGGTGQESVVKSGPIVAKGKDVSWTCPSCEAVNAFETDICERCGTSLFSAFSPPEPDVVFKERKPELAAAMSILPGAGHVYAGRVGEGVTRFFFGLWWLGTFAFLPGTRPALVGVKVVYAVAFIALVLVTMIDASNAARHPGSEAMVKPRTMIYLSLALLGVLIVGGLIATLTSS